MLAVLALEIRPTIEGCNFSTAAVRGTNADRIMRMWSRLPSRDFVLSKPGRVSKTGPLKRRRAARPLHKRKPQLTVFHAAFNSVRVFAARLAGRLAGPAFECMGKRTDVLIAEQPGDLRNRQLGIGQVSIG